MCESLGKSIIRDIILKEGILHIESNKFISIGSAKDSSKGIMSQDLIIYSI